MYVVLELWKPAQIMFTSYKIHFSSMGYNSSRLVYICQAMANARHLRKAFESIDMFILSHFLYHPQYFGHFYNILAYLAFSMFFLTFFWPSQIIRTRSSKMFLIHCSKKFLAFSRIRDLLIVSTLFYFLITEWVTLYPIKWHFLNNYKLKT